MFTTILASLSLLQAAPLTPGKVYDLPKPGRFDVITFDRKFHRVLAAHSAANTLAVLDTETGKMDEIDTGSLNGVAVAGRANKIFAGGGGNKLVVLDRETLKVLASIDLGGPADVIAVDSKRGQVYVSHDDGTEDWVFDADTLKLIGTVTIEEAPEFLVYDSTKDQIFQNIKSTDHVQVIDPESRKVVATWPTDPMKSPHGIALDRNTGRIYSAGRNGKLVVIDVSSGKVVSTLDIGAGTDEIAFDAGLNRLYCPGGDKITVIDTSATPKVIGSVDIPKGARSITVDPATHDVWIAYGDDKSAHFAQFKAGQ
jgi:DNA-binding beta-propeller fold protein YncE